MSIQQSADEELTDSGGADGGARPSRAVLLLVAALGFLLLTVIFFGWIRYGVDLFLTFAATGLSYCF